MVGSVTMGAPKVGPVVGLVPVFSAACCAVEGASSGVDMLSWAPLTGLVFIGSRES